MKKFKRLIAVFFAAVLLTTVVSPASNNHSSEIMTVVDAASGTEPLPPASTKSYFEFTAEKKVYAVDRGYVDPGDYCKVIQIRGNQVYVDFPTSSGRIQRWFDSSKLFGFNTSNAFEVRKATAYVQGYKASNLKSTWGKVYTNDVCFILKITSTAVFLAMPLTGTSNYRFIWVKRSDYNTKFKTLSSQRVALVNNLKDSIFDSALNNKTVLTNAQQTATGVFASKTFLKGIGIVAGSIPTGFTTALVSAATDVDTIIALAYLDVTTGCILKAIAACDKVLSYRGKSLNSSSALELIKAYREMYAWELTAYAMVNPILQEFADLNKTTTAAKIAYLSKIVLDGAFDSLMDGMCLAANSKAASTLLAIRKGVTTAGAFCEAALPAFPAYSVYTNAYNAATNLVNNVSALK